MTDIAGNRTLSSQWNETVQFYGNQNFLEYISVDDQLTSYTYSEFHYRVIQTANWFHSLGIRKGERWHFIAQFTRISDVLACTCADRRCIRSAE